MSLEQVAQAIREGPPTEEWLRPNPFTYGASDEGENYGVADDINVLGVNFSQQEDLGVVWLAGPSFPGSDVYIGLPVTEMGFLAAQAALGDQARKASFGQPTSDDPGTTLIPDQVDLWTPRPEDLPPGHRFFSQLIPRARTVDGNPVEGLSALYPSIDGCSHFLSAMMNEDFPKRGVPLERVTFVRYESTSGDWVSAFELGPRESPDWDALAAGADDAR